jgi:hypothetical protein
LPCRSLISLSLSATSAPCLSLLPSLSWRRWLSLSLFPSQFRSHRLSRLSLSLSLPVAVSRRLFLFSLSASLPIVSLPDPFCCFSRLPLCRAVSPFCLPASGLSPSNTSPGVSLAGSCHRLSVAVTVSTAVSRRPAVPRSDRSALLVSCRSLSPSLTLSGRLSLSLSLPAPSAVSLSPSLSPFLSRISLLPSLSCPPSLVLAFSFCPSSFSPFLSVIVPPRSPASLSPSSFALSLSLSLSPVVVSPSPSLALTVSRAPVSVVVSLSLSPLRRLSLAVSLSLSFCLSVAASISLRSLSFSRSVFLPTLFL